MGNLKNTSVTGSGQTQARQPPQWAYYVPKAGADKSSDNFIFERTESTAIDNYNNNKTNA